MNTTVSALSKEQVESLQNSAFYKAYKGAFVGILRWHELDVLWSQLESNKDKKWYIYAIGETPPDSAVDFDALKRFIHEVDKLLRREHDEGYCGIVYADNCEEPQFIKIFDPNNLGSACGSSGVPSLPGWILSTIKPVDLPSAFPQPGNRKRWWTSLFG